jgi:aldose sugar dehydrogenase
VTLGTGFNQGITDIETGPDGYLYVLTFGGDLYRIVPATTATAAATTTTPTATAES